MAEETGVQLDPEMLVQCYGLFSRVVTQYTKYLRDDRDTYSPMMDRLRRDGMKSELLIDAYLAVQRMLGLNNLDSQLFDYTERILFMDMTARKALETHQDPMPWNRNPLVDTQSAAWFKALSSDRFIWANMQRRTIGDMYDDLNQIAREFWEEGQRKVVFTDLPLAPDRSYEAVDPDMEEFYAAEVEPNTRVH